MSASKLVLGDCLLVMDEIPDSSVDMLFADLPYGQTQCEWDKTINLYAFWRQVNRVCKEDAAMVFTTTTKFGAALICSNADNFRFDMVWKKSCSSGFLNARRQPLRIHEMVYVFYRKQPSDYVQNIEERHAKTEVPARRLVNNSVYAKHTKCVEARYNPPLPVSVLDVASVRGKHVTQKPLALIDFFVRYYTKPGDTVLDPTMGSGSTGCSCKDLRRDFIGIELNDEIFEGAKKRIEAH